MVEFINCPNSDPLLIIQLVWLNHRGLFKYNHDGNSNEALIKNTFIFYLVIQVETEYGTQY